MNPPFWERLNARGLLPTWLLRQGIRRRLRRRVAELEAGGAQAARARTEAYYAERRGAPIAVETEAANAQHYELPPAFFEQVLGPRRKYSGCLWEPPVATLAQAETAMLDLTLARAEVAAGQRVLDLGCGWGALTFRLFERFPDLEVVAVSNSRAQRALIEAEAARRGVTRLRVVTGDANTFVPPGRFDRIVSVEMFEHLSNHEAFLEVLARALEPGGRLFTHVFCHARHAYPFVDRDDDDWMARYFFTGGWMPSADAFARAGGPFRVLRHWDVPGTHYARTAAAWVANMDARREAVLPILAEAVGAPHARLWFSRWRTFFLACEELWAYRGGTEWFVAHDLMAP